MQPVFRRRGGLPPPPAAHRASVSGGCQTEIQVTTRDPGPAEEGGFMAEAAAAHGAAPGGTGPGICPALLYTDAKAAIRSLVDAFGFTEVVVHEGPDGSVAHAELSYGSGVVMLGSRRRAGAYAELMADAGPSSCYVVVEGGPGAVDAHHARARAEGMEIVMEPTDKDYGSRDYMARDAEGNVWSFGTYAPSPGGSG
jgi:uncharacterized glyoxalase superfamily protein PhnB